MFENEMLLLVLLLGAALIAGYFYLKRAQRRDAGRTGTSHPNRTNEAAAPATAPPAATDERTHRSVASENPSTTAPRSEAPRRETADSEALRDDAPRSEAPPPRE